MSTLEFLNRETETCEIGTTCYAGARRLLYKNHLSVIIGLFRSLLKKSIVVIGIPYNLLALVISYIPILQISKPTFGVGRILHEHSWIKRGHYKKVYIGPGKSGYYAGYAQRERI